MLGSVSDEGTTIVADLEAGIGTLTRLEDAAVDVTVVVVEPTPRSIDVALRAISVAQEHKHGRLIIVANKIVDADDSRRVREAFSSFNVVEVPADSSIDEADRLGVSPLDHDPTSPAVRAFQELAAELVA